MGILFGEGVGQVDRAVSFGQVLLVQAFDVFEVFLEGCAQGAGQDGDTIPVALAIAHRDRAVREAEVLHAQAEGLQQAQAAAVEQLRQQLMDAGELGDNAAYFW
jgi:hypothetical protein